MSKRKIDFLKILPEIIVFVLITFAGVLYLNYTINRIERAKYSQLLNIAESIESVFPQSLIASLDLNDSDTKKEDYQKLKHLLAEIILANPQARFCYLLTLRGDDIIFYVDSEPEQSDDASPPGQIYYEADKAIVQSFKSKKSSVVEIEDRWGEWISVFVPVIDRNSKEVVAVLGMDFDASLWKKRVLFEISQSVAIVVLVYLLFIFGIILRLKNKVLHQDISRRIEVEQALRESESKYRSIADKMTDVVWLLSLDGKSLFVSPSIKQFTGFSVDEYMVQTITERFTYDCATRGMGILNAEIKRFLSMPNKDSNHTIKLELEYKCKDGSTKWGELIVTPYLNDEGVLMGIHGVTRDVTDKVKARNDLIKAKEKAEESDRLKSAFLSNMSHEIRTPMNGILGFAGLLKRPGLSGEKQNDYIQLIEKSGLRMLSIINDIIDISKIESGQMPTHIHEISLNEQLESIHSFFKIEASKKGLNLNLELGPDYPEIKILTDSDKLDAILINLIKNAIKFTKKGSIRFGYSVLDNHIEFYVKDTGRGIDNKKLDLIFERFRQESESHSRDYEGAGLGLSIAKAYVEMLGGKIWVNSIPNQGSEFYFTIAYIKKEKQGEIPDHLDMDVTEKKIKQLDILIAEDNQVSALLLENYLNKYSKQIIFVTNGAEALEKVKEFKFDIVFMDLKMPKLSGYETIVEIRKFNKELVIIAQSAFALKEEKAKAFDAGCNDYLTKPYSEEQIDEVVKRWM